MHKKRKETIAPYLFIGPSFVLIGILFAYPIIYTIFLSVHKYMLNMPQKMVSFNGLENYKNILTNREFLGSIGWTFSFSTIAVSIELVIGIALATMVNNKLIKQKALIFRTLLIMPMMLSPIVTGVMWRILFEAKFGVVNYLLRCFGMTGINWLADEIPSKAALIVTDVWHTTPFVMLIFFAALQTVPDDLLEAAKIDGANGFQSFFKITIPYLRNFIALIMSVRMMDCMRFFDEVFVLTKGGPGTSTQTLAFNIYRIAFRYSNVGAGSAGALFFLLIIMCVSLLIMRIVKGKENNAIGNR